ncbi:hypothetical protein AWH49_06865 [Domibacillus aminovorans]|uniref:Uncharacterized protein n=1 Tax=Domibacillus aminovorans TaxID=29332 RepID=A0A177LET9_9BACI|nr:hypothetical protein AWH49_06865 [Domibacillus aminovorans]
MSHLKFFVYQFVLISALIAVNYYSDEYISKPFGSVDLLAIGIIAFLAIVTISLTNRLYNRLGTIRLRNKILLTILAFVLVCLFIVLFTVAMTS